MRETALIMQAVRFPWAAEGGGPYRRGGGGPYRRGAPDAPAGAGQEGGHGCAGVVAQASFLSA